MQILSGPSSSASLLVPFDLHVLLLNLILEVQDTQVVVVVVGKLMKKVFVTDRIRIDATEHFWEVASDVVADATAADWFLIGHLDVRLDDL